MLYHNHRNDSNSILVVVHPGSMKHSEQEYRNEEAYGNYEKYLTELKDSVWQRDSVILTSPPLKSTFKRLMQRSIPFKVPKISTIIKDRDDPQRWNKYLGEKELIPFLRERGVINIDVCGESLWYQPQEMIHPGCVLYYYRALNSTKEFSVKVRRGLCFPIKEPFNDGGTWFSQALKTYSEYRKISKS